MSDQALEQSPNNSRYLRGMDISNGRRRLQKCLNRQAIKIKPDLFGAYLNLGCIYKDLGKLDKALSSTLKSLEIKPDLFGAYLNLGCIYKDLGKLDKALASAPNLLKSSQRQQRDPGRI